MLWLFLSCSSGNNITCSVVDCPPKTDDTGIITGTSDLSDPEPVEYEELDTGTWPEGAWVDISAGGWHTCAIDQDAQIHCWGRNTDGQINAPEGDFRTVTAGRRFTCAIGLDAFVQCWGELPEGVRIPITKRFLDYKQDEIFYVVSEKTENINVGEIMLKDSWIFPMLNLRKYQ